MNLRNRIGIVHAGHPGSAPDAGRTRCGQTWITFQPTLLWQETQDEVDCMACIEHKARLEGLFAALSNSAKKWRRDPLSIAWSPIQAPVEVLDGDTITIMVHDEIIVT